MSVEVENVTELFEQFEIPCSGLNHAPGEDIFGRHGDLSKGAEWYIKQKCSECGRTLVRPVCDAFVKWMNTEPEFLLYCPDCFYVEEISESTSVLCKI